MTTRITTILALLILFITTTYSQSFEPLELAKKIFSQDSLANIDNYSTGEYDGRPNGKDLQKGTTTKFILLGQSDKNAVVRMTILDSAGKGFDAYLHFERDSIWKMNAFRALAMTGIIERVVQELEKMTSKEIDEIIKQSNGKEGKEGMFKSKQDYDFELGNAKLTLELDDNAIKHFLTNQTEFERLKNLALTQLKKEKAHEERRIKLIENYKDDYRRLFISSVSTGGYELGNCINFLIGGILDNTLGYIYVKDKKDLPEMNPDSIIMIKEIANGWYIYKTT